MGLTRPIEQKIKGIGLDKFFEKARAKWIAPARKAFNFARDSYDQGATIRRDDVAENLEPVLKQNEAFKEFLDSKKQTQNYWYRRFADFIVDRVWDELQAEVQNDKNDKDDRE